MDKKQVKKYVAIFAIATVFVLAVIYIKDITAYMGAVWSVLSPFVIGAVIAYIANLPYGFFYNRVFAFMGDKDSGFKGKLRNPLSILLAYLFLGAIIAFVLGIIIPQIKDSVDMLSQNIDSYIAKTSQLAKDALAFLGFEITSETTISDQLNELSKFVSGGDLNTFVNDMITKLFPHIFDITAGITSAIYNTLISIVVSIYMLAYKKNLLRQIKMIICSIFSKDHIKNLLGFFSKLNLTVGRFIYGKILDSFIIGVLCFICLKIFGFEYAALISIVVGITNVIPFFGPIIGAIPCFFLLLIVNPVQALWFVVFALLLQQFDGNILGPKILGSAIGINGFWVMFGVIVGGGLFGFPGMILGVPVFAVLYCVFGELVNNKLKKRSYAVGDDKIDLDGDEIISNSGESSLKNNSIMSVFRRKKGKTK